jgi:hypothetical protein
MLTDLFNCNFVLSAKIVSCYGMLSFAFIIGIYLKHFSFLLY